MTLQEDRKMKELKLFGTENAEPRVEQLAAGNLTAIFDRGALRNIRFGGDEILRGVSYLSRAKDWGTFTPDIANLKINQDGHSFVISFEAKISDDEQSLKTVARIEGRSDGSIFYSVTATALSDFITNRTGFVVLHPLQNVVGQPVKVIHTDGAISHRRFPDSICPSQPIFNI